MACVPSLDDEKKSLAAGSVQRSGGRRTYLEESAFEVRGPSTALADRGHIWKVGRKGG